MRRPPTETCSRGAPLHSLGDERELGVEAAEALEHHPLAVVPRGVGLWVLQQAGLGGAGGQLPERLGVRHHQAIITRP